MTAEFSVIPQQTDFGILQVECQDGIGNAGIRLVFDTSGYLLVKAGYRNKNITKINAGGEYNIKIELNTTTRFYTVTVNGKTSGTLLFFAPLESVERVVFRTGEVRRFPDADTPTDQMYDLPGADKKERDAIYYIKSFTTKKIQ
jgi:hypothetical protein